MKKKVLVTLLCVLTLAPIAQAQTESSSFDKWIDFLLAPNTKWFQKLKPHYLYSSSLNLDIEISYTSSSIGIGSIGGSSTPVAINWVCDWDVSICDSSQQRPDKL